MHLGNKALLNKSQTPLLKIGEASLSITNTYRYLGMTLDTQLNFKAHTKIILRNINHKTYMFRRTHPSLTEDSALKVLKCIMLPVIDYADIIHTCTNKTILDRLQNAFERALKTLYPGDRSGIPALSVKAKVNKLSDRRHMHLLDAAFNLTLDHSNIDDRDIRTRAHDGKHLLVKRPKNPIYRKSLEYRLSTTWNSLKTEPRILETKEEFQRWNQKFHSDLI